MSEKRYKGDCKSSRSQRDHKHKRINTKETVLADDKPEGRKRRGRKRKGLYVVCPSK